MRADDRGAGWGYWLLVLLVTMIIGLSLVLVLRQRGSAAPAAVAGALPTARVLLGDAGQQVAPQPALRVAPAALAPTPLPTPGPAEAPAPTVATTLPTLVPELVPTLVPTLAPAPPALPPENLPAGQAVLPPILMYHYIRDVDPAADSMGYNLSIAPADFEQQLAWLQQQGYVGVAMATVERCMRGQGECPARAVGLTFDDGYEDAYSIALPILQRYGMHGTFYVVNSFVGQPGYMSWEQLAALRDAGMEIGAHTVSHLNLTSLDAGTASYEIGQSKAEIEQRLGVSVASFCYPAGFYDPSIEGLVQAAGYTNATTTRWDFDYGDMYALPRRRIAGGTALDSFAAIVAGG